MNPKAIRVLKKITAKDTAKAKHIPSTMSREQAHEIIAPDVMRQIKSVFGV